jgi:hypothetical protein
MGVLLSCGVAMGQINDDSIRADNIDKLEVGRPIAEYILGGLFIVGVLAIGFKNSKRTHLD